ncbi:MAG: shikimate dehydrogenase [Pyrinomonadaceae bacterium]
MNRGKICVSVCAETAEEFNEKVRRAEKMADLVELRFDCLKKGEKEKLTHGPMDYFIQTFRPIEQGGKRSLSAEEREKFWNSGNDYGWGDFEEDVVENHLSWLYHPVICSFHDFDGVPDDLVQIYERINFGKEANIDVIKIAVRADDITDTIPLWKLFERAKTENKQLIPIAMGEPGKWTRILGLAHGAPLTYAALDAGQETAPGQVSARDLIEVYRARELDENTEVYGVIAGDTGYTMSPYLHNAAFKFHALNSVFIPLQVADLDGFMRRMVLEKTCEIDLNFRGFAVTNPHKAEIIKHLDELDETARQIGAVNTVQVVNGSLFGYNTDAEGFIAPLKTAYGDLKNSRVAIFGAGGAARACLYALKKEGAEVTIFARNIEKARLLAEEFNVKIEPIPNPKSQIRNQDIVVNTTPLGTRGALENETILTADQIKNIQLAYDLVYNPIETRFLREAENADIPRIGGLAMLVAQAAAQTGIWTGLDAPVREMSRAALRKLQN